jgi:uncharacterized SAM-binding protein YcdF (DUF218 family)
MDEKSNRQNSGESNNPDVLIVLGAPNDRRGKLSAIAMGRAEMALKEYNQRAGCKIILTGGYGKHFNTARRPHAYYMAKFLISHGVSPDDLLELVESSNTIEDALLSKRVLHNMNVGTLFVITSGFHMERAQLIFNQVFRQRRLIFIEASCQLSPSKLKRVRLHEAEALGRLREAGPPVEMESEAQ